MLQELFRYYWNILKNGRLQICSSKSDAPYGREELKQNQHWYGFTALALVCGLAIGVSGVLYWNIDTKTSVYVCKIPVCIFSPSPTSNIPPKDGLALGTKVTFTHFQIPKPAPQKETIDRGIKKDRKVRNPKGKSVQKDWESYFIFPDTLESKIGFPDTFDFDIHEPSYSYESDGKPEMICSCPIKFPYNLSFFEPKTNQQVDEAPIPVNLDEVRKLIGYPQILRDAGIVGGHDIQVMVSKEGIYDSHATLTELHPIMTEQMDKHIKKLIFTPAIRNGKPVTHSVKIPFRFCVIN